VSPVSKGSIRVSKFKYRLFVEQSVVGEGLDLLAHISKFEEN
jgi:hypothetical protein